MILLEVRSVEDGGCIDWALSRSSLSSHCFLPSGELALSSVRSCSTISVLLQYWRQLRADCKLFWQDDISDLDILTLHARFVCPHSVTDVFILAFYYGANKRGKTLSWLIQFAVDWRSRHPGLCTLRKYSWPDHLFPLSSLRKYFSSFGRNILVMCLLSRQIVRRP